MAVSPAKVVVPIFPGHGSTAAAISDAYLKRSLSDSLTPSGSVLSQSCYHAFLDELASLPSNDFCVPLNDFPSQTSLLSPVEVLNAGTSSAHVFERQIPAPSMGVGVRNLSASRHVSPVMEPIAIVGMAVNMPGAPNIDRLWELLYKGESTLSQVWVGSHVVLVFCQPYDNFYPDTENAFRRCIHPRVPGVSLNSFSDGKFPFESRSVRS